MLQILHVHGHTITSRQLRPASCCLESAICSWAVLSKPDHKEPAQQLASAKLTCDQNILRWKRRLLVYFLEPVKRIANDSDRSLIISDYNPQSFSK